ncbi:MAG: substrate-binding domain-containing protein [Planctomycetes bacterium]|nr:substrate-binding domain-containing protein [Planctomycetota bacterium]
MEEYVWISKLLHHPVFVNRAHPILRRFAATHNIKITLDGTDDEDTGAYLKALKSAIKRRVAGIMTIGWDESAIPLIDEAMDKGIPVVTVDSDIPNSKRLAHVGTDWYRMGVAMAEEMVRLIGEEGEVLMIGILDLNNMRAGFRGFKSSLEKFPGITILGPENDLDVSSTRAEAVVGEYLQRYPHLKGIAGFDGNSGPGAALAIEKAGKSDEVKIVCVDAETEHLAHLRRGSIDTAFCQKREAFTYFAFQFLYSYNHGSPATAGQPGLINIPGNIDSGFIIVTKENSETFTTELSLGEAFSYHELSQQFRLMSHMIENIGEIALAVSIDGQIIYVNPATERLTGFNAEELRSKPVKTIFATCDGTQQFADVINAKEPFSRLESEVCRRDGSTFPVRVNISPLISEDTVRGAVFIAMDITDQKQSENALRASENNLATTLNSIGDAVIVTDPGCLITRMNPVAEELTGWSLADALGKPLTQIFQIVYENTGESACNLAEKALASGGIVGRTEHVELLCKDNFRRPIAESAAPIRNHDENLSGVVLVFRDQTLERKAQNALREAHDSLEHRVKERTLELQQANERLSEEIRERRRLENQLVRSERMAAVGTLAGGVAHEFNNINVTILGFSELALEWPNLEPEVRGYIERILKAAQRARGVTHNLLSFSQSRQAAPGSANLVKVIEDTIELVRSEFESIGIQFKTDFKPIPFTAMDPGLIGQVILNLITNAQHAMLGKDKKVISIKTGKQGNRIFAEIKDTGCGIHEKDISKIFTPFFSRKGEHARNTPQAAVKGTGLGLSICHTIIENHDGEIEVQSVPDKSTTFTIWLPIKKPDKTSKDRKSGIFKSNLIEEPALVVVLDDEAATRDLLKLALERKDNSVFTTDNGNEALQFIREHEVNLVFVDIQMPIMDGFTFVEKLQEIPEKNRPAVIIITGKDTSRFAKANEQFEIFGLIQKPIELAKLSRWVSNALTYNLKIRAKK